MPYTTQVATLQSNIIGDGATVTAGELDALDALVLTLDGAGITAKLKEVHIPVGSNATAARRRLIFKSGASQSTALSSFSGTLGAQGQIESAVVSTTDFTFANFSFGVLFAGGFTPSAFGVLMGANSTDINVFSYDWAGAYNKVRGYSLCLAPRLGPDPDQTGDTMLYAPSFDGFLAVSGGAAAHHMTRDGELIMHQSVALTFGVPLSTGTPLYLPFNSSAYWHASFAGSYLTPTEMAILSLALRTCMTALGRTNLPAIKTRRVAYIGDSRTNTVQSGGASYAETLYKQTNALLGWASDTTETWDFGMNGMKLDTAGEAYPTDTNWLPLPRTTGARAGRLGILWRAINDLNQGASAATARTRLDARLAALTAAGYRTLVLSEVGTQSLTGDVAGYNALLAADAGYTNGSKSWGLVRVDQITRLHAGDRGDHGFIVDGLDSNDTLNLPPNHSLANGDEVDFVQLNGGSGLATATRYFMRDISGNTGKLAATSGGSALSFGSDILSSGASSTLKRNRSCTATTGGTFTTATPHGFAVDNEVKHTALTGGSGLTSGLRYYVVEVPSSTTYKVSLTKGGAVHTLSSALTAGVVQREATTFDGVHLTELGTSYVAAAIAAAVPKILAVPTINSASSDTTVRGEFWDHQVTVDTALSFGAYTYAASGLPTGLSIDTATGLISGTPTAAAGGYSITITATNENGSSTPQTFNLTLQPGLITMPETYEDYRNWVTATARALFTPADDTENPIDLGDISLTRLNANPQEVKTFRNRGGGRKLINQKTSEISPEFEVTIGEENRYNLGLRLWAKPMTDANQAAASAVVKTFSNVKHGATVDLGKVNVSAVVVKVGVTTKTLGTDYSVDAPLGLIRILDGGTIVSGTDDIEVTFDHPAQGYAKFQTFTRLNRSGRLKLYVEDEYSDAPRGIHEFDVNIACTDAGEIGAQKATEWKAKLSVLGNATYMHRKLAA